MSIVNHETFVKMPRQKGLPLHNFLSKVNKCILPHRRSLRDMYVKIM